MTGKRLRSVLRLTLIFVLAFLVANITIAAFACENTMSIGHDETRNSSEYLQDYNSELVVENGASCKNVNSIYASRNDAALEQTSAKAAVVMEANSGRVLFQKNADERLPMASTTKIATALTVLRLCDVTESVEVAKEACGIEGSSVYLRAGEHLTVNELLLGLMLRSGNDCAVALAIHASGSVEKFVDEMNVLAADCGCENTHFANPHGLHNPDHYTSARDLAKITSCALQNPTFAKIVSTKFAKIANEFGESDRVLINKNKLLSRGRCFDGVKTGFTKAAGRCFVGSMSKDDLRLVCVVLNCGPMFEDTEKLLTIASQTYKMQTAVPNGKTYFTSGGYYVASERFAYPVCENESLSTELNLDKRSPCVSVKLNGVELAKVPLKFVKYR